MYEFNQAEKEFLKRLGATGNGKELLSLLKSIRSKVDRTSNIPKDSDYGAQVEGRRLAGELLEKLIANMSGKRVTNSLPDVGVDEFD